MSIDNNAILMVGKYVKDVDLSKIMPEYVIEDGKERQWLDEYNETNLTIHCNSGYSCEHTFIGFIVGDSDSYGHIFLDIDDITHKIEQYKQKFFYLFDEEPQLILFNYTW